MSGNDLERACDIAPVRGQTLPKGRSLETGEMRALFEACARDRGPSGRRDAALLAIAYGGGLRRTEIANLMLEHFNTDTGELKIIHGKGNKERNVYLPGAAKEAVVAWLAARGPEPGALFVPIAKGSKVIIRKMSDQAIYNVLLKRQKAAKIKAFSPHDMRRSFASDLLDAGGDVVTVQRLMGHSSPSTTAKYDRRGERTKMRAAGLLFVPYTNPGR